MDESFIYSNHVCNSQLLGWDIFATSGDVMSVRNHLSSLKMSSNFESRPSASRDMSDNHEDECKMASTMKGKETVVLSMITK